MDYKELKSLSEAYQSVYSPQELIEEQVWEEVENWVHSLLEEGYDLSDYTWEEMYESYLSEVVSTPPPVAMDAFASGGGAAKMAKSGMTRDQVIAQGNKNNTKLSTTTLPKPAAAPMEPKFGVDNTGIKPLTTFTKPTTPAAPARPGAFAPRPATTPEKPMGGDPMDQWTRANPTLAAKVKPGQSGYNTIRTRLDADNDRQENYDAYDLVLSHLINEGYADTQEAALAIMGNMSEDWKYSIVEETLDERRNVTDRPLGIMHRFARGVRTGKGEKTELMGSDKEGNLTGKYLRMKHEKKTAQREKDADEQRRRDRGAMGRGTWDKD